MAVAAPRLAHPAIMGGALTPGPVPAERLAAERLGAVYLELKRLRALPLGRWAIIPEKGYGQSFRPFTEALGLVYGSDTERERKYGRANYLSRYAAYKKDCDLVLTALRTSTLSFAAQALERETTELTRLLNRLSEPGRPEWMHAAADEILAAYRREIRKQEAIQAERPPPPADAPEEKGPRAFSNLTDDDIKIVRERTSAVVQRSGDEVIRTLFQHPDGMKILGSYAESAQQGTAAASVKIIDALVAVGNLKDVFVVSSGALRYRVFITGGIAQRKLDPVPGFTAFAVEFIQLTMRDSKETLLTVGMIVLAILAIILLGPGGLPLLAEAGIAGADAAIAGTAAAFAGADLLLAGANTSLTFAREREQDLANRASQFEAESNRWATSTIFQDTIYAGAAALLTAIAFFGSLKELRGALYPVKPAAPPTAAPPAAPAGGRMASHENKAIAGRANGGAATNGRLTENPLSEAPTAEMSAPAVMSQEAPASATAPATTPERMTSGESKASAGAEDAAASRHTERPLSAEAAGEPSATVAAPEAAPARPAAPSPEATPATGDQQSIAPTAAETAEAGPVASAPEMEPVSEASRMRGRGLEPPAPPEEPVPDRNWREDERRNIQAQIQNKEEERAREAAAQDQVRKEMEAAAKERNIAKLKGNKTPAELAKLEKRVEVLTDEYKGFDPATLAKEKLALTQLLNRTTLEYYDALTNAASKAQAYIRVSMGRLDSVFKPFAGALSVEHVLPRFRIFQKPKFLSALIWEQQKFLFNLPKNLKLAPAVFNGKRGIVPYGKLPKDFANLYIKPDGELLSLIRLEAEVDRDLDRLIANPRDVNLWREFGYDGPFR